MRSALAGEHEGPIDELLAQLDWLELLEAEPDDAIDIVFSALGNANAVATSLDDVLALALGVEPGPERAVLLPPFASWDPPGRLEGGELHARGLATARLESARELLVVCGSAEAPQLAALPTASLEGLPVRGVDPDSGYRSVELRAAATPEALKAGAWESAVALGRRAVAHQMAGTCRAMLELARTHALEREQFGRPISRFQAVRHRLAEALVAVESAEATLLAARLDPGDETAALAKACAGSSAQTVARHCQQVLGGVGFTTEHAFHHFLKRNIALEGIFGSGDAIALQLGRQLLASRRVPALIEL